MNTSIRTVFKYFFKNPALQTRPPGILGGKRCLPVADPQYIRGQSGFLSIFVCIINVVR